MRVQPKGLILFDWESAAREAPALWDRFHFLAQTECHLNLRHDESAEVREQNRALYLLYLLASVAQLTDENSIGFTFRYRERQLRKHLSEPGQAAVAD